MEDNISMKDKNGRTIDTGMFGIIYLLRLVILLITFPLRMFFFFLNPFPTKNGAPRQIKIRK